MAATRLITRAMHRYWRLARPLTMGAQGCVLDANNRVLLVRHGYRPGWHFPGGGIEKRESAEAALRRELIEEAGIVLTARPILFGIYNHHPVFTGDHIVFYVVRNWRQEAMPPPNSEIAERGFFAADRLPDGTHASTAARLKEVLEGRQAAEMW